MAKSYIIEAEVENLAIHYLLDIGYKFISGPDISSFGITPERDSFSEVILLNRLRRSLSLINPNVSKDLIDQAITEIKRTPSPDLIHNNEHFHYLLCNGLEVEYSEQGNLTDNQNIIT